MVSGRSNAHIRSGDGIHLNTCPCSEDPLETCMHLFWVVFWYVVIDVGLNYWAANSRLIAAAY